MTASPRQVLGLVLVLTTAGVAAWLLAHGPPSVVAAPVDNAPSQQHHRPSPTSTPTATPSPPRSTSSPTPAPTLTPAITPTIAPTPPADPSATPSPTPAPTRWPVTGLHYTANGNFGSSGQYLPGADGFNLADVSSVSVLDGLPAGTDGLVWIGSCEGSNSTFQAMVSPFIGNPRLFGFYMVDEPDPSTCLAANLKAEDDWIHAHVPGARTFAILQNFGSSDAPTFAGTYTPQNADLDLIGLDPYPVRSELPSPDYAAISGYVRAAEAAGWPQRSIVPVYQAFGGGTETDGGGGHWSLPTAAEETAMLADWAGVVPTPVFDYAYSWGTQFGDTALSESASLQAVFTAKNAGR